MLQPQVSRNYLSRLAFGAEAPEQGYNKVNLLARALCPTKGVKSFEIQQVRVLHIDENGAVLQAQSVQSLTDHFYLCLGQFEILITCACRKRNDSTLVVRFSKREETAFIRALTRIDVPITTMQRLSGQSSQAIETRITANRR